MHFAVIGDCLTNKYKWVFCLFIWLGFFCYNFPGKEQFYYSILMLFLTKYFLFKGKTEIFSELLYILSLMVGFEDLYQPRLPMGTYPAQVLI